MCGIAGSIGNNSFLTKNIIVNLEKILKHRGPDSQSFIREQRVFLFHARLSIIDIRKISNQPMYSNDRKLVLVFNGEIYNYIELKKELSDYQFKTKSDSEVILAAYSKWGKKCLNKLYGAFAFCIYDFSKKETFFSRDRFGQKPIFFYKGKDYFNFASEIKALIVMGYKPEADSKEWNEYILTGRTDENNSTFFKNINQLLPGECATLDDKNNVIIEKWYDLKNKVYKNLDTFEEIKLNILEILKKKINICSRADVSLAVSLSGGLDSNILFSIHNKFKILKKLPECYSVDFGSSFSEKKYIKLSTDFYNQKSNFISFSVKDWLRSLNPIIWHLESPSGGLMNCALSKLNYKVSNDGFKVIQDATGLDEIFGGYEFHHLLYLKSLQTNKNKIFDYNLKLFCENWGYSKTLAHKKLKNINNNYLKTIDGFNLTNRNIINKNILEFQDIKKNNYNLKDSLISYVQNSKIPRNNRLKDRISMAFGLELRLPFLEHDLVEYGLSLENKYYFLNGRSKSILREAVKDILPPTVNFNKKISVHSPQTSWFKVKEFRIFFEDIINSDSFKSRNYYNVTELKKEWKEFLDNKNNNTSFYLWQVINLEMWHRIFLDNNCLGLDHNFNY